LVVVSQLLPPSSFILRQRIDFGEVINEFNNLAKLAIRLPLSGFGNEA